MEGMPKQEGEVDEREHRIEDLNDMIKALTLRIKQTVSITIKQGFESQLRVLNQEKAEIIESLAREAGGEDQASGKKAA